MISPGFAFAAAISSVQRFRRDRGVHRERQRPGRDLDDRRKAPQRVVRQALVEACVHHEGVDRHHDGVAVGLGAGGALRADVAAGAGLVLDHDRLVPALAQLLADDARKHVDAGARRERHDDEDRCGRRASGRAPAPASTRASAPRAAAARRRSGGFMRKLGGLKARRLKLTAWGALHTPERQRPAASKTSPEAAAAGRATGIGRSRGDAS